MSFENFEETEKKILMNGSLDNPRFFEKILNESNKENIKEKKKKNLPPSLNLEKLNLKESVL
jgi:hypothetical protein